SLEAIESYAREIRGRDPAELLRRSTITVQQHFTHACVPAVFQTAIALADPIYAWKLSSDPRLEIREQREMLEQGGGRAVPRDSGSFRERYPIHNFVDPVLGPEL